PGPRTIQITATSIFDPTVTDTIEFILNVEPYGEPELTVLPNIVEIEPGMTAFYTLEITNKGNVNDTFSLSFTSLDFGSLYEAYPSAIDTSWISFIPLNPSAVPGATTSATLQITVPSDWAAWEDVTYEFIVAATSSVTPDYDSDTGQLLVYTTTESKMFWVKAEIIQLRDDVDAMAPSGVKNGLHAKASAALNKINQSIERYLLGDDPPASNLFRTTKNMLRAFLHLVRAQRGKGLTDVQADYFSAFAQKIRDDIDEILAVI
ncbi:MAG: COG1470 family protein, partial [Planctomycetota bacterium]